MNYVKKLATDVLGKSFIVKHIFASSNIQNSLVQQIDKMQLLRSKPSTIALTTKMNEVISWYDQVTGMYEVRDSQQKVIDAETEFVKAQEKRRELNKELTSVQNKLKDLYSEIDATNRGEERYITLITKEHQMLKEEKRILEEFNFCERKERDLFTILSSAVKESHKKERAQAERTKYWSLIGSILGTLIGVIGSSLNNRIKMKELKELIHESQSKKMPSSLQPVMAMALPNSNQEELKEIITDCFNDTKKIIIIATSVLLIIYLLKG